MSADERASQPSAMHAPLGARRRRTDAIDARPARWRGTLIALVPLVLVLYYLLKQGLGAWSWTSSRPTPPAASSATPAAIK